MDTLSCQTEQSKAGPLRKEGRERAWEPWVSGWMSWRAAWAGLRKWVAQDRGPGAGFSWGSHTDSASWGITTSSLGLIFLICRAR